MARHMARRVSGFLLGACLVAGLLLLAIPLATRISTDWKNSRAVSHVSSEAASLDEGERAALLAQAHAYNDLLAGVDTATDPAARGLAAGDVLPYGEQLGAQAGAVGWVQIPKASVELPLYLGTSDDALAAGVGHLEGSSLPVGGAGTHCVLTGHSGMATSRMFDRIRELGPGDLVGVHVLGEELVYEVSGSEVVWPGEVGSLVARPGEDLVTLVTCTPFGVNDHRLLVYCHRTDRVLEVPGQVPHEEELGVVRPSMLGSAGALCGSVACVAVIALWRGRRRRAG